MPGSPPLDFIPASTNLAGRGVLPARLGFRKKLGVRIPCRIGRRVAMGTHNSYNTWDSLLSEISAYNYNLYSNNCNIFMGYI